MTATFYVGDAIEVMSKLPEKSVDLILTSPPFLALRSYLPADHPDKALEGGSQSTPGEYIDWLLDVVEACARVLAPHGSLCIELGDTYAGSGGAGGDYDKEGLRDGQPLFEGSASKFRVDNGSQRGNTHGNVRVGGLDGRPTIPASVSIPRPGTNSRMQAGRAWPLAKSLSLIPESFRFAMVYGTNPHTGRTTAPWRLRNVIRWVRPNPPVGALGDKFRPATSELMVFCKSAKRYFDLDAVREPAKGGEIDTSRRAHAVGADGFGQPPRWTGTTATADGHRINSNPAGAPPLDWWNIPPGGYEGAHYAVWPPELCVKPVKAMCPEKVCRQCGEPSRRIVEHERKLFGGNIDSHSHVSTNKGGGGQSSMVSAMGGKGYRVTNETTGWTDCGHDDWRPGLVIDPFVGSGTTLMVATGHGRDAIGIDLDERNYDLALTRVGPFILERGEI